MSSTKILLVEGKDDEHVLKHICRTHGLWLFDEVTPLKSVDELLKSFPVWLKKSDIEALGVVVDADSDVAARWQSLHDRLVQAGYRNVPKRPVPEGTILSPPPGTLLPRVGLWIMPDNRTGGILEDFLTFLVPRGSGLFDYVKQCVADIPDGERLFSPSAESKAVIHTWLAWQEEPGKPLGTAITARYLDGSVNQVEVLVAWLRALFS